MKKYLLLSIGIFLFGNAYSQKENRNLIVGTYTNSCEQKGIYVYNFDLKTGAFHLKSNSENVINPSYVAISHDNQFLYSVNENGKSSKISAFGFDADRGKITPLNSVDSKGADPCYILDDTKNVLVANYSGGNIAVFGKKADGSLTEAKQVVQHKGRSKNSKRQESAHVHMVQFSPDKKFVLANDLGTDKVYIYKYNPDAAKDILEAKDSVTIKKGSGPRHLTFSPSGKFVYLLQELDGTLTVFNYEEGHLRIIQEQQIVMKNFTGQVGAADIHVTPDGRFLYATDRGTANDITCYKILPDGRLNFKANYSTKGKTPRNFAIDPEGNFLLVANQESNNIVIFKINKSTGELTNTDKQIEVCAPVCLVFSE